MMSTEPMFFEIEAPHPWVNTMDVTIYSGWIYMINWPEIEKMDMIIDQRESNLDTLEKFAREQYRFAAPGEDVYIIEE